MRIFFLPAGKFQGAFHTMAIGVNEMVKGHEKDMLMAMDCVKEFAGGNFDKQLPVFSGKKVFINENTEGLRKNLKDMNAQGKQKELH